VSGVPSHKYKTLIIPSFQIRMGFKFSFGPYFIEPIIAGLHKGTNNPFIASTDLIGCINFAKDFVVVGTASENLFGMAESLWEPDLVRKLCHLCFVVSH
jgi:20S proteasome alpha/beta subunit